MGLNIPLLQNNVNHPVRFGAFGRCPQPHLQDQEIASQGQPQSNLKAELVTLFTVPRRPPAGNPACQQTSGL